MSDLVIDLREVQSCVELAPPCRFCRSSHGVVVEGIDWHVALLHELDCLRPATVRVLRPIPGGAA